MARVRIHQYEVYINIWSNLFADLQCYLNGKLIWSISHNTNRNQHFKVRWQAAPPYTVTPSFPLNPHFSLWGATYRSNGCARSESSFCQCSPRGITASSFFLSVTRQKSKIIVYYVWRASLLRQTHTDKLRIEDSGKKVDRENFTDNKTKKTQKWKTIGMRRNRRRPKSLLTTWWTIWIRLVAN